MISIYYYFIKNIRILLLNIIYILLMGSGKPRGIRAGRKLATKRRLQK